MRRAAFKYTTDSRVFDQFEETLALAVAVAQALHGEAQARLDLRYLADPDRGALVVDAATPVGRDLNRIFVGLAQRQFGEDSFRVERVGPGTRTNRGEAA